MANNKTETSFYFQCGTAKNATILACWINGGSAHNIPDAARKEMLVENADAFEDDTLAVYIANAEVDGTQVWVSIEEGGDIPLLAILLRAAMATMPEVEDKQGFQWAETCSKPRVNEFGGGACFIRRGHEIEWLYTGSWLDSRMED